MLTASSKALSAIDAVTMLQFTEGAIRSTGTLDTKPPIANLARHRPRRTPEAANAASAGLNLNADAAAGDTVRTSTTAYDRLGTSHLVTFAFTKGSGVNQWAYAMSLPHGDLTAAGAPATGTLTIDNNGSIVRSAGYPVSLATPILPKAVQPAVAQPKLGARLPRPSPAFTAERENLILAHLPQVRLIARRIHERLPDSVNLDDLISTGAMGLISAIDRFDPSLNVKLKTYAEYKIRGAILDSLRGLDWAPRQQRKRHKQIEAAIAVAEQRLHRTPSEEEIAAQLGVDHRGVSRMAGGDLRG